MDIAGLSKSRSPPSRACEEKTKMKLLRPSPLELPCLSFFPDDRDTGSTAILLLLSFSFDLR
jgi:hypothetical protein